MTDTELVVLSQQGDLRAFNELAGKAHAGLFPFVRRMLGTSEDAQDVCQEALLKAYLNIRRLREPEKFRPWLHHIALNLCRDWHRSAQARPHFQSLDLEEGAEGVRLPEMSLVPAQEEAIRWQTAQALLERLSLEQRTAILLREYQGFTSDEIAEITGVPAATVRTRIFYGLRAIHQMLAEQNAPSDRPKGMKGGERA
ncbi:MAG: RNA polymerase sigma factor [Candidatus Eisenbacteria bacterium]|nr:RNA polymerase sigma factor [Candidatus Eisenbacteria bacterium]